MRVHPCAFEDDGVRCSINTTVISTEYANALRRAIDAYSHYSEQTSKTYLQPRRNALEQLMKQGPETARTIKRINYSQTLDAIESAVQCNGKIAQSIATYGTSLFKDTIDLSRTKPASDFDCTVARGCIRSLFRDWTIEGAAERLSAHAPILQAIRLQVLSRSNVRVLVPGAGLGRLAYSIHELGCSVEWNDISCHTMLASLYMLSSQRSQPLYPWGLSFSNHMERNHQFQRVTVPDIYPNSTVQFDTVDGQHINFRLGSFVETYSSMKYKDNFSALATCYFIDTASNFLEYVDAAWNCIERNGIWVNIGPLLWNTEENGPAGDGQADMDGQDAWVSGNNSSYSKLELTAEEVIIVLQSKGFIIEQATNDTGQSTYVGNSRSMLEYTYKMAFWVARKPVVC